VAEQQGLLQFAQSAEIVPETQNKWEGDPPWIGHQHCHAAGGVKRWASAATIDRMDSE